MDEYDKCYFCKQYDEFDGCTWGCEDHQDFEPNKKKILAKARDDGISVADLIAIINMG